MAGIDPQRDPRGARWERRLRVPVLGAALLAVPTVLLYFSDMGSTAGTVAVALSWLIWAVFLLEAVIMLSVVAQRRLAFTWCGEDGESSLVELTLDDAPGGGTILTVFEVPLVALRVASRAVVAGGERAVRGPAMVAVCA